MNDRGEIVDRYDKRFCAGDGSSEPTSGDLAHYSPGNHFTVFSIGDVLCGALICHDYRYPELYREYKRLGVQLVFHSYNAAHMSRDWSHSTREYIGRENLRFNQPASIPGITMQPSMRAAAAANHVWISCPNSSARESCWPSFFIRPDGVVTGKLRMHAAGILLSQIDTDEQLYDSTVAWRDRAMSGILHSGTVVDDVRSELRTEL